MENLPFYIVLVFGLTVLLSFLLFYKATNQSKAFAIVAISWVILQSFVGLSGFYQTTNVMPPRVALLGLPPFVAILLLFLTAKGRKFIDNLEVKKLTLFHIIRIPVEFVLFWLFIQKAVPELMTFEGRNFDILSGLTAPLIYYFGFIQNKISKQLIIVWNFICLGLLINIVVNAVLSVPTSLQQFAFEQPNIAILYFPFVLLPSFLVPLVFLSHLTSIRQLLFKANKTL